MPLTLYKRGKIYHYRGTLGGGASEVATTRLRGSTGTTQKDLASQYVNDIERQFWKGHRHGQAAVLTFAAAASEYRKMGRPDRFLESVEDYWKTTLVKDINNGRVRQGAMVLYPTQSNATRNRQFIVPTMAIINHAASMDLCPLIRVKRFPEVRKEKTPATWEWIKAFMAVANPHLGALACFMFLTGTRVSDALALEWGAVDLSTARVLVCQGKLGGEERLAHLPPALVVAMANIQSNREDSEKVFKYSSRHTARTQWEAAYKRASLPRLTFHTCRHGFATGMMHAGVDPITVAKLGGWKDAKHVFTTYGHAMADDTLANRLIDTPVEQSTIVTDDNSVKSAS